MQIRYILEIISRRKIRIAWVALVHGILSAVFWVWAGTVALGLGFKDKQAWSVGDQIQATVVSQIALTITTPGRFLFFDGWPGLLIPWLANSLLWSVALVLIYDLLRSRHDR